MDNLLLAELDPRAHILLGGDRWLWCDNEKRVVYAMVTYLAQGCQWGSPNGVRDYRRCRFCNIPAAAEGYLEEFNHGRQLPPELQIRLFKEALDYQVAHAKYPIHTMAVYNAGSFLEPLNPPVVREAVINALVDVKTVKRIVIESRVATPLDGRKVHLLDDEVLAPIMDAIDIRNVELEIRFGVESGNKVLRNHVLGKGCSEEDLREAADICQSYGITSSGYILLHPAPHDDIRSVMDRPDATEEEVFAWTKREALQSLQWLLRPPPDGIGFKKALFRATSVQCGSGLEQPWREGRFSVASNAMTLDVARQAADEFGTSVELLPDKEEPEFIAIPSNHTHGLHQDLRNAQLCDRGYQDAYRRYRETMNPHVLVAPDCPECNRYL